VWVRDAGLGDAAGVLAPPVTRTSTTKIRWLPRQARRLLSVEASGRGPLPPVARLFLPCRADPPRISPALGGAAAVHGSTSRPPCLAGPTGRVRVVGIGLVRMLRPCAPRQIRQPSEALNALEPRQTRSTGPGLGGRTRGRRIGRAGFDFDSKERPYDGAC